MRHTGANMRLTLEVLSQLLHFNFSFFFCSSASTLECGAGLETKKNKKQNQQHLVIVIGNDT